MHTSHLWLTIGGQACQQLYLIKGKLAHKLKCSYTELISIKSDIRKTLGIKNII